MLLLIRRHIVKACVRPEIVHNPAHTSIKLRARVPMLNCFLNFLLSILFEIVLRVKEADALRRAVGLQCLFLAPRPGRHEA